MPYNTPINWVPTTPIGAADLNAQLRDNIRYLHNERPMNAIIRNNAGDYTTTSATMVDIDATNLSITLTVTSGRVAVWFVAGFWASANPTLIYWDIFMDSVALGAQIKKAYVGGATHISLMTIKSGISVGSHTFRPRWSIDGGINTGKIFSDANSKVLFAALEV